MPTKKRRKFGQPRARTITLKLERDRHPIIPGWRHPANPDLFVCLEELQHVMDIPSAAQHLYVTVLKQRSRANNVYPLRFVRKKRLRSGKHWYIKFIRPGDRLLEPSKLWLRQFIPKNKTNKFGTLYIAFEWS